MGKLSNQLSTWRKDNLECKKGNVATLWFKDTQPNIMFVQNDSDQTIYISIDHIPTRKDYTFNVKPHNSRLIARPYKTGQIYVLNDGGLDASITVWSIYDTFRPEMLQDFTIDKIDMTDSAIEAMAGAIGFDGVIRGFANGVKLPEVAGIAQSLKNLISSNSVSNTTNLYNVWSILSTISGKIQSIYEKDYKISEVTNEIAKSKPISVSMYSSESETATKKEISGVNNTVCRFRIGFLSNDSANRTLHLSYTLNGGRISSFTLKPNETLHDVWIDRANAVELSFTDGSAIESGMRYWVETYSL